MANITIQGNKETILDNDLLISSTSTNGLDILRVDASLNRIAINKNTTATSTLDIEGSVAVSTTFRVQNKLIVDLQGRVGINVVPTTYQLHVRGDTLISGSLQVIGSYLQFNSTTLDIQDPNILINKNGNDTTAAGAGFTIQKTNGSAQFIWDNTRQNFRIALTQGASTTISSILRSGGNNEGASIAIGTKDNYSLDIRTNNISRITIDAQGTTTFSGSTISVASEATVQGLNIRNFLAPPGTIIAFLPGTFSDNANGSFTLILGSANTAASVNTWLAANGYAHWKVCDGSTYNIAGSQLYNASGRFTPNLTDARFLAGFTTSAATGGTNSGSHTHNTAVALASVDLSHTHSVSSSLCVAGGTNPILTSCSTSTGTSTTSTCTNATSCVAPSGLSTVNLDHNHGGSCTHYHNSAYTQILGHWYSPCGGGGSWLAETTAPTNPATGQPQVWQANRAGCVASGTSRWRAQLDCSYTIGNLPGTCVYGDINWSGMGISGALSSFTRDHIHEINAHTHDLNSHAHSFGSHNHDGGSHSHTGLCATYDSPSASIQFCHTHTTCTQTGPSSTVGGTENRPSYLTCFYLVRVI